MPCGDDCLGAVDRFASLVRRPKPPAPLGYRFSDGDGYEDIWFNLTMLEREDCPE